MIEPIADKSEYVKIERNPEYVKAKEKPPVDEGVHAPTGYLVARSKRKDVPQFDNDGNLISKPKDWDDDKEKELNERIAEDTE